MSNEKIYTEIKEMISEVIEIPYDELDDEALFVKDLGVDSLRALEILAMLEKKYKIDIDQQILSEFTNVNKTIEAMSNLLKENNVLQ